jgi:hypothetical protein
MTAVDVTIISANFEYFTGQLLSPAAGASCNVFANAWDRKHSRAASAAGIDAAVSAGLRGSGRSRCANAVERG